MNDYELLLKKYKFYRLLTFIFSIVLFFMFFVLIEFVNNVDLFVFLAIIFLTNIILVVIFNVKRKRYKSDLHQANIIKAGIDASNQDKFEKTD